MKLRMLAVSCVVLAISALGVTAAGASTHIDVRPYLGGNIGIGTSVPGDPSSVLCLVLQDGTATYGGKVNGTVVPARSGELNINIRAQDLVTPLPTCVSTAISIDTVDATNIAIQNTAPKTGGTLQISTSAGVQPGINATATTTVRVHYAAGQVIKLPTGAVVAGGALSGGSFVDLTLKPVATITKASLNLAACSDSTYFIDTNRPDGSKSNGPTAVKTDTPTQAFAFTGGSRTAGSIVTLTGVNTAGLVAGDKVTVTAADATYNGGPFTVSGVTANSNPTSPFNGTVTYNQGSGGSDASSGAGTATHNYAIDDPGVYLATLRDCAENTATTPGKAATTKISVTGPGTASVDFLNSSTDNPAVWDTSRGGSCSAVKTGGTFGTTLQSSRVLACKGDYGAPIPLSLAVRNWLASGVGFKDSYGLIHPGPPVELLSHTFS